MLKKLKTKFIIATMLSLVTVIGVIIMAINLFNYGNFISRADDTLTLISKNEGRFPHKPGVKDPELNIHLTPESPYEARYFTVDFHSDGTIAANTKHIAAVNSKTAIEMAELILESERDRGFLKNYRYLITYRDGKTRAIFLDCTRELDSSIRFLFLSISISLTGIFFVFLLLNFISKRIVSPIIDGYEKQKRFITDAGHDIKTPLTIIAADAELVEMELGENEWLTDIKNQTTRLTSLTNDLIYLARMEEVESMPHIDFPISDIAEEVISSFASLAKTKKIVLEANIAKALFYCGDESSIRKLFTLLIDNAIKYSPEGERVILDLKKQGRNIVIRISNLATNINNESIKYMFDRFYRSDPSRSSKGGFGIGLSVAQAIVTSHKGKISAHKDGERLIIEVVL